jgi:hypothetical protein
MSEGTTARPGEPVDNDVDLAGVPVIPAGATLLAVVSVSLYRDADGTEDVAVAAVNADGGDLPGLTAVGLLVAGSARLLAE